MAAARPMRFWILWAAAAVAEAALLAIVYYSVGIVPRIEAEREGKFQLSLLKLARDRLDDRFGLLSAAVERMARLPDAAAADAAGLQGNAEWDRTLGLLADQLGVLQPGMPQQWPLFVCRFRKGQGARGEALFAGNPARSIADDALQPEIGARAATLAAAATRGAALAERLGPQMPEAAWLLFAAPLGGGPGGGGPGGADATLVAVAHVGPLLSACLSGIRQNAASQHYVVGNFKGAPELVWHSAFPPADGRPAPRREEWCRLLAARSAKETNAFGARREEYLENYTPEILLPGPGAALRWSAVAYVPLRKHDEQEWALFQETPLEDISKAAAGSVVRWTALGSLALGILTATLVLFGRQVSRGERALQSVEATYRTLFAENPAGMFVLERDGRVVECNDTAARLAGMPAGAAAGRELSGLFDSPALPALAAAARDGADLHLAECPLTRRADGSAALAEVWGHPLGERWMLVAHDIGKRREFEREVARFQRMDSMGALASTLAHDFNNRLGMIQIRVSNIRTDLPPDSELRADAEAIEQDVEEASQLVAGILAFRDTVFSPEPVRLEPLLRGFMDGLERLCKDRGVVPSLAIAGTLPEAWITPQAFRRVLDNLCRNALDAMPDGGTLAIAARPRTIGPGQGAGRLPPGEYAEVAVADTGTGIAEQHLEKVFQPLFTTKAPGQGTGLGLWTAYTMLRNLGGDIGVRSKAGQGTRFELLFPNQAPNRDSSWFRKEQG